MEHTLQNSVINFIRNHMKNSNITQADLAINLETSRQTISNYLTSSTEMTLNMMEKFAEAIGVPVHKMLLEYKPEEAKWYAEEVKDKYNVNPKNIGLLRNEVKYLKNELAIYKKIETQLNREIDGLYKRIEILEKLLSESDIEIEKLKNKQAC